jgi:hypothetical protein
MENEDSNVDYWSLSPRELAARIAIVAEASAEAIDSATRAEAGLLAQEWRDAIKLPSATFPQKQEQVSQLDALQKRTIEILVRTSHAA